MKKLAGLLVLCAVAQPASAESYSRAVSASTTSPATFDGFDGSLGTLQKVTFTLSGTTTYEVTLPSLGGGAPPSGTAQYDDFTNSAFLYLNSSADPSFHYQPAATEMGFGTSLLTLGKFTATTSATNSITEITNASLLAAFYNTTFSGGLFVDPPYAGTISVNGGSPIGVFGSTFTTLAASVGGEVTYTYAPLRSAVPEPASWAMMILGFGIAATALRRPRRTHADTVS